MDEKKLQELLQNPDFRKKLEGLLSQKKGGKGPQEQKDLSKKEKKEPTISEFPSYSLEVISVCNLCKSWTYKLFNMHKKGRLGFVSIRVSDRSKMAEPRKRQILAVTSCPQCKHKLLQLDKSILINKLVQSRTECIHEYWIMCEKIKELDNVDNLNV